MFDWTLSYNEWLFKKHERSRNNQLKAEFESLAASVSAREALIKDYETNDTRMKKLVVKFQHQIEGTYDGDEELKEMIKTKMGEIETLKVDINQKVSHIKKLKRRLRKTRNRVRSSEPSVNQEDQEEAEINGEETKSESAPLIETTTPEQKTEAEYNPDDYVSCSVQ